MADSYLTSKEAALALLPVQTSGEVSVQDMRDIINSVPIVGEGRWNSLIAVPPPVANVESYRDSVFATTMLAHDDDDPLSFTFRLPDGWTGDDVSMRIAIIPMSDGSGTLAMRVWTSWGAPGVALPAQSGWSEWSVAAPLVAGDRYRQKSIVLADGISPIAGRSDLHVCMQRNLGADTYKTDKGLTNPSWNVAVLYAELRYRTANIGSASE